MSGPSEEPTLRNPRPALQAEPKPADAEQKRSAPSEPKLAYSEVPDPPTPRTDRIARGAGRVSPPRRTATPPAAAPHRMAPRPHVPHGGQQHRQHNPPARPPARAQQPAAPQAPAQPARRAPAPQARPATPAAAQASAPPSPQAPNQAPKRARPQLTAPEWAAAAAMIVLVLAVLLGLALA